MVFPSGSWAEGLVELPVEVPGQSASRPPLFTGYGAVQLPIHSKSKLVQLYFDQGLTMHYHHEWLEADRAFREAATLEPDCAMAWWGLALVNRHHPDQARSFIVQASQLTNDHTPSRELHLIETLSRSIAAAHTRNRAAKIPWHLALQESQNLFSDEQEINALELHERLMEPVVSNPISIAARIRSLLESNPDHPLRASCLGREDELADVRAYIHPTAVCRFLPEVPRTWRESGHYYLDAGRPHSALRCFEQALSLEHRRMRGERRFPAEVPGHARSLVGLVQTLAALGMVLDALNLAEQMAASARPAPEDPARNSPSLRESGQQLLLDLLLRHELWNQARHLANSPLWEQFHPKFRIDQSMVIGAAAFGVGDKETGRRQIQQLQAEWQDPLPATGGSQATTRPSRESLTDALDILRRHKALAIAERPTRPPLEHELAGSLSQRAHASASAENSFANRFACWRPLPAPELTLPDSRGQLLSLRDFSGKPVLLVFFLGAGCAHCIEQLSLLAPLKDQLDTSEISLVAISTDTVDGLEQTNQYLQAEERFPFPIVSDSTHQRFRAYGAFDEFRNRPLHGVFLVDGRGRMLWRHTGPKPFMQVEFLLDEANRVLKTTSMLERN